MSQLMKISGTQIYRASLAYYARSPHLEIVPLELELDAALGMKDTAEIPRLIELGEEVAEHMVPVIRRTIRDFHGPKNRFKRRMRAVARRCGVIVDLQVQWQRTHTRGRRGNQHEMAATASWRRNSGARKTRWQEALELAPVVPMKVRRDRRSGAQADSASRSAARSAAGAT
jgi:hypothetical protein